MSTRYVNAGYAVNGENTSKQNNNNQFHHTRTQLEGIATFPTRKGNTTE